MGKIVCREFRQKDMAGILRIEAVCFADDPWPTDMFEWLLSIGTKGFVIGRPVRAAIWVKAKARYLEIANVATLPEWQGKGYARKLLAKAEEFAKEQKKRGLMLDVHVSNSRAIRLYESLGFIKVKRKVRYYKKAGGDAWEMKKRFK